MPTIEMESKKIPRDLHIMQHIFRGKIHFPIVKSIANTDTALLLGQHIVYSCLEGIDCKKSLLVNTEIGHVQHYRKSCPLSMEKSENCEKLKLKEYIVKDIGIWKYLETVIKNTNIILRNIDFY